MRVDELCGEWCDLANEQMCECAERQDEKHPAAAGDFEMNFAKELTKVWRQ